MEILAKLLWVVVKMLGYVVLSTVVFLALGFAVYDLLRVQLFTGLPVIFAVEGLGVMFFGAFLMRPSPVYVRPNVDRFMPWVPIRQLRENLKGAAVFVCSGLLVFIIGLLLAS